MSAHAAVVTCVALAGGAVAGGVLALARGPVPGGGPPGRPRCRGSTAALPGER